MGAAQTGTGKTAAFSLPLLQRMLKHENASTSPARHPVRALVLLPTRELADQVAQQVKLYAKYTNLRSTVVFGGIDMKPQTARAEEGRRGAGRHAGPPARPHRSQERGAQPGRVRGARRGRPHAGHRLPAGPAAHPVYLPKQRTTLLFSATFSPEIKRLASYLQDPVTIEVRWRGRTPRPPPSSSISTA
jgi:ATP-dependent RNA helicase RhlE